MFILDLFFRSWVRLFAGIYGSEGINIPFKVMPTRYIAPTLGRYGATIGQKVRFLAPLVIHNGKTDSQEYFKHLHVGNHCYFGRELFLDLEDQIIIEDTVTLSHRVMILTHTDAGSSPLRDSVIPSTHAPVHIRRGAYIGAHVTILQGIEIGEEAVVGAGAVVTHSIPARAVAVGVPAKVVKTLST